jgi:CRISPR-associated endonuclease/helicase Cas3
MGGDTLAEHTWQVVAKLAALHHLRSTLSAQANAPHLWHVLFWACMLHDFGKAAHGFQAMLRGEQRWKHRHEVLSLAFVDWLAGDLSVEEQRWLVAAIVTHHRDVDVLQGKYPDLDNPDPLDGLCDDQLDAETVGLLWDWLNECAANWRDTLSMERDVRLLSLLPRDLATERVMHQAKARIRYWLDVFDVWHHDLQNSASIVGSHLVAPILLRGLTTSADHMASAHLQAMPPPVQENWRSLASRILIKPGLQPYTHQEQSAAQAGRSALLMAPTGSGKTEAALYWAVGDGVTPLARLFYALPYQASMNAMFDRLANETQGFGKERVGLQHGRALQALYARLLDQEELLPKAAAIPARKQCADPTAPRQAAAYLAKWEKNINTLNARPVKVFSPYQMFKAVFQLKGFEALLTDYAQAAFIFDEIHAYEPRRLALLLALISYLQQHFGARFFLMSATFPRFIREKLHTMLGVDEPICADADLFEHFRRHRLHLLDGELDAGGIQYILADVLAGKQVLVCANTVYRAQDICAKLRAAGLPDDQIVLIHSRFITKHRTALEAEILRRSELDSGSRQPFVLVATQVVEVSLNIDLDTIYTDPAPLEALLQRFGRVNRARHKGICPVYVFRQPDDGQYVYGRSNNEEERGHIVRVTLAELEQHDGDIIDEAQINDWLDQIYADPLLQTIWTTEYQQALDEAQRMLRDLRPFQSDPQQADAFDRLFDGIDVLPSRYCDEYLCLIADHDYIAASQYMVNINVRTFGRLKNEGLIRLVDESSTKIHVYMVELPYSEQTGLSFDQTGGIDDN